MDKTVDQLPTKENFETKITDLFSEYLTLRANSMKDQISKFND
jgi:hypothetical protein